MDRKITLVAAGLLLAGAVEAQPTSVEDRILALRAARFEPLRSDTVSARPLPRTVTPPGSYALSVDGDLEMTGYVFKGGYPFLHNDGGPSAFNTALGLDALVNSTPGVPENYSGMVNTAFGAQALYSNTGGCCNTAAGGFALGENEMGISNTAIGAYSLRYNLGDNNTALGNYALYDNTTGNNNLGLGIGAGFLATTGDNNIFIANGGDARDDAVIRIGQFQTSTFIDGIVGVTVTDGIPVLIDANDQLGTMSSSRRYKEAIETMGDASAKVGSLRPVTFRYTEETVGDGPRRMEFGLIAEEVAEVYPELVVYDQQNRPYSVRYHVLIPMLLNELQRQQRRIEHLEARNGELELVRALGEDLIARVQALETRQISELATADGRAR